MLRVLIENNGHIVHTVVIAPGAEDNEITAQDGTNVAVIRNVPASWAAARVAATALETLYVLKLDRRTMPKPTGWRRYNKRQAPKEATK